VLCWKLSPHGWRAGRGVVKSRPEPIVYYVDCLFPYHVTGAYVRTDTRPLFFIWLVAYSTWVLSFVLIVPRIAITWTCGQFDWFSLIIIFHRLQLPLHKNPTRQRVSWLIFLKLPFACLELLGCLELFSNSHSSVLRECCPWVSLRSHRPASHLTIKRTICSELSQAW
jgi:hypothetical protein